MLSNVKSKRITSPLFSVQLMRYVAEKDEALHIEVTHKG